MCSQSLPSNGWNIRACDTCVIGKEIPLYKMFKRSETGGFEDGRVKFQFVIATESPMLCENDMPRSDIARSFFEYGRLQL